ncbi:MAG TPA: glycosyltransferase, partial [Blastocatellia bacterium]|nr:glycosyltransferase [Blastocatellia bacterium]
ALAEWFDYGLLDEVAGLRPDWNFLLIGPVYDLGLRERGRTMLKRQNVRWIGRRAYETLPGYLNLFDVAIIPFVINAITLATSPLKLYEFFAAGKPVVTTRMPECEAFPEVHAVAGAREFSEALEQALAEGQDSLFRDRLRRLGRENSWAARVETVLQRLRDRAGA